MIETIGLAGVYAVLLIIALVVLIHVPLPVGVDRGKVKWQTWCGTGMHWHSCYWTDNGFQTLHPKDKGDTDD